METIILGGGLAGVSLACYLDGKSVILEAEDRAGGLCRSFPFCGGYFDIGPHILFSKNEAALKELLASADTERLRRSNRIFHNGRFVKYPFENELSALAPEERDRCLREFLDNPYRDYPARNMLQFFLKTFGEGITRLYLQPYNEKIWKFDPAFMDTQMVERIPRPPDGDIRKSAAGEATEGYLHQLYFNYPRAGGIESVVRGFLARAGGKTSLRAPVRIKSVSKSGGQWVVDTDCGEFRASRLVNCMPLHELFRYIDAPSQVKTSLSALKYNSIHIVVLRAGKDGIGDNFAVNIADRDIIFHRLSRLNFLGEKYAPEGGGAALMAEITFRPESDIASWPPERLIARVKEDLAKLSLAGDITDAVCKTFKYAYVIYDLEHKKNKTAVIGWLESQGITCCGRFAEFEYLNMDAVVASAIAAAGKLCKK
ncbi:MAG: FAD-dependent oxidoreductase [Elusimicrobiales bacterium]